MAMRIILVIVALVLSGSLQAHQQKEAYTTVLFNERTGNLEISHRFYLHDAEHGFARLIDRPVNLEDEKEQKAFARYVEKNFRVNVAGTRLILNAVGHEVEGKYIWVYQEAAISSPMCKLEFTLTAFQEIWSSQTNQVNVERHGRVQSVRLTKDNNPQQIVLQHCSSAS